MATPIVVIKEDGTGTITPKDAGWLFLRDIDISDLAELRAHWLGRPAAYSQRLMDRLSAGGLPLDTFGTTGEVKDALSKAASP